MTSGDCDSRWVIEDCGLPALPISQCGAGCLEMKAF